MRRDGSEMMQLSAGEEKNARHFGEKFWLYVVTEAGPDEPELHRIQDPAARFREREDIFAAGFIVHRETWRAGSKNHIGDVT